MARYPLYFNVENVSPSTSIVPTEGSLREKESRERRKCAFIAFAMLIKIIRVHLAEATRAREKGGGREDEKGERKRENKRARRDEIK